MTGLRAAILALLCGLLLPLGAEAAEEAAPALELRPGLPATAPADPAGPPDQPGPWEPGAGEEGPRTRFGARFDGALRLEPVRLHLALGGHVEGLLGGVDRPAGELVLMRAGQGTRVDLRFVRAWTPLSPPGLERGEEEPAVGPLDGLPMRWVPTWRSHAGAAMSLLLPGTGQFIQEREQGLGAAFLGSWSFFVASGLLALLGPVLNGTEVKAGVGGTFLTLAVGVQVASVVHAFRSGRERRPVAPRTVVRRGVRLTAEGGRK